MELRRLSGLLNRVVAQTGTHETLLSKLHFQAALRRERLRADRCLSTFSLLTIGLGEGSAHDKALAGVVEVLESRVRESDIAGWFADGVIGIILPETASAGAWQLADDLQASLERRQVSVSFEVYAYPSQDTGEAEAADAACDEVGDRQAGATAGNVVRAEVAGLEACD